VTGTSRLRGLDALFLRLDGARTPMHMGSVAVFEGAPLTDAAGRVRIEKLRAEVEDRLDLVPNLRRRPLRAHLAGAAPVWVDDERFDLATHVRVVAVPAPGTSAELGALSEEILAVPLDFGHPLWELWFVEGLAGGRVGLIQKIHHALADGLGGVEMAMVLLDTERHPRPPHGPRPVWYPEPAPGTVSMVAREGSARLADGLRAVRVGAGWARHPGVALGQAGRMAGALATVASPRVLAPRSPLNRPIGQARRVAFVRERMDLLTAVERAFGVTVNDILLCAVAGGLRSMLSAHGADPRGELQALVPVGVPHEAGTLGNQVSAMLGRVPVGIADPVERLSSVARSMARVKGHHQSLAAGLLVDALDFVPEPLLGLTARAVHHQPFVNLVVTNVPGTPFPLYAHGARMLEVYPIVPLGGNLSLGVAALSYDGAMHIGLYGDREACGDLNLVAGGIRETFGELAEAAGVPVPAQEGTPGVAAPGRPGRPGPARPRSAPKGTTSSTRRPAHPRGARQ